MSWGNTRPDSCLQCGARLPARGQRRFCGPGCYQPWAKGHPGRQSRDVLPLLPLGSWVEAAVCRSSDPELFHPAPGGDPGPALRVCRGCPVRAECLSVALAVPPGLDFGVWGGTSARDRRKIRRQRLGVAS